MAGVLRSAARVVTGFSLALGLVATVSGQPQESPASRMAVVLDIRGPIGPAVSDYVVRGIDKAQKSGAALVVLRMDTPGGLDSAMREIVQAIVNAPLPVASFVPAGGRAASAGTYILYASHIAAMAPGTNLGAATPVRIGGGSFPGGEEPERGKQPPGEKGKDRGKDDGKEGPGAPAHPTIEDKALNDAIAYIRSLAQMRGRNVEWAEKAVRQAASLAAEDAAKEKVIDFVARDLDDLLAKADGRTVTVAGREQTLRTGGMAVVLAAPDWRSELLGIITNPNVAYLLLMIGIYGIIFEFYSPGFFGPGIIGAISLLLGLYALQMLPVSYAGLGLTLLGLGLMVAEAFVPSGALGIGGAIAFVIGSILLIDTDAPGFGISWVAIAAVTATSAAFSLLVLAYLARSRQRAVVSGPEQMVGSIGRVMDWNGMQGHVHVHGERWSARAAAALAPGAAVRVRGLDGLTLEVEEAPAAVPTGTVAGEGR